MSTMLAWSVTVAQILLALAMACATFRILGAKGAGPGRGIR